MIKFGVADYGLSVWDGGYYDLELRLEEVKQIGYDGLERLEAIDFSNAVNRAALFRKMGMDFATCRCGNVEMTNMLTAAMGKDYVWLTVSDASRNVDMEKYIRQSNRFIQAASRYGLKCALHNHLGARIEQQEELDRFMKECPGAYLLLDIGHLYGAGGDILRTIDQYHDRIACVHFKDVFLQDETKGLDKWYERLRFCELSAGNCNEPWKEAGELLRKHGYDGWVLVEQDTHMVDPLAELKTSVDHLKNIFC